MSWWKQQLKEQNGEIRHKVNRLRVSYIDLLQIEEKTRQHAMKQASTPQPPTNQAPKIETIATFEEETKSQESIKNEETKSEESTESSDKDILSSLPEKLRPWVKKVYYYINLKFHPDKCENSPKWFKDWLSSYQRADWLQFILFTDNVDKIWLLIEPPKEEIEKLLSQYCQTCLQMTLQYQNQLTKYPTPNQSSI